MRSDLVSALAPRAIKVTAGFMDRVRPAPAGLVVLIYHRVGGRTSVRVDLPIETFDKQVAEIAASCTVLALGDAVDRLRNGEDLTGSVVVTFDDGTADFVDEALPVLERYSVPATLFVATRHIEDGVDFPDDGRPVSWRGLSDAISTGLVTIGSHTHGHLLLDRLDPVEVADDLDRSIDLIGDRLGVAAEHFAYPKALTPSAECEALVRSRFRSASLAGTCPNPAGTDVHRLSRSPIQTSDDERWFRRKLSGGMRFEDDVRRFVNRRRYAGASS